MTDKIIFQLQDSLRRIETGRYATDDGEDEERALGDVVYKTGKLLRAAYDCMYDMYSSEYRYAHASASAVVDGKLYTCTDPEKPEVEEALEQEAERIKEHWRDKLKEAAESAITFAEKVQEPCQKKHKK